MRGDNAKDNLAEIVAMLRVSGRSSRALSLQAGRSEDTVKKIIKRGGNAYEATMDALRDGMRRWGYDSWLPEGLDERRLIAALVAASRSAGPITPENAAGIASLLKEVYDDLVTQPELTSDQIQIAANNLARGAGRRRRRQ